MTRFEFVNKLNGRLYLLSESERLDIIDEYVGHIDMKMQEGKSEAEAIKDFGDIDELAREILDAYHIDSTKIQNKTLDIYIKQTLEYFSRVTEKILSFSTSELAHIFVEFIVLLIILNILRFPVILCSNIFSGLFSWLPYTLYHIIDKFMELLANILCLALGLMFIYQFINKRIINARITPPVTSKTAGDETSEEKNSASEKFKTAATEKIHQTAERIKEKSENTGNSIKHISSRTGFSFRNAAGKTGGYVKKVAESTGDFVINLATLVIRIILRLCVWLPCVALTIAGIVCTVLATILYFTTGIGFMGICVAGVGCCVIGIAFTIWLTQMMSGGKVEDA